MKTLFKPTSYHSGAAMAVSATAVWKFLSFANALLIAAYFGAGADTDLYFYLMMLLGFALTFLQRMNAAVIIPQAMAQDSQTPLSGRILLNQFLYIYGIGALVLCLIGWAIPVWLGGHISRFSAAQVIAQQNLITLSCCLFGLQLLVSYLTAILEMYRRFATALFSPLNALLPLLSLLALGKQVGIASMLYGFIAANFIQLIIFGWALRKDLEWHFSSPRAPFSGVFTKNLASNQTIELANIVSSVLPLYLLSGLAAGLVSALNYAKQLSDSSTEILTLRVTNISKIQLTQNAAENNWEDLNVNYNLTHHFLWFLLTPLAVFSIFYAPEIITIFFKRGAFSVQDAEQAAGFLRPLLGLMWLMVPVLMQNNVVVATRKIKEFLPYALTGIGIFIVSVPLAMHCWGAFAYPYAQLVCCVIGFFINAIFFRRYLQQFMLAPAWLDGARLLACNLIALIPSAIYAWYFAGKNSWVTVLIGGIIYVGGLLVLYHLRGELKFMMQQCCPKTTAFKNDPLHNG